MRVLVTGSRQMLEQSRVYEALDALYAQAIHEWGHAEFTVVHGAAPGADALAGQWVHDRRHNGPVHPEAEVHPAQWNRYGTLAGGIRNAKMVGLGADVVLAFFQPGAQNVGTRNCVAQSRLAGLEVRESWE